MESGIAGGRLAYDIPNKLLRNFITGSYKKRRFLAA